MERMFFTKYPQYIFPVLIIYLLFINCSTTLGLNPGNNRTPGSCSITREKIKTSSDIAGINIVTVPENANIFINNRPVEKSPFFCSNLKTGFYSITIRKRGYYPVTKDIWYNRDTIVKIETVLEPVTGFLEISVFPEDSSIMVDSTKIPSGKVRISSGEHKLFVKSFGYKDYFKNIFIGENETETISVNMEKADFALSTLKCSRDTFNPESPGSLGNTEISFEATAPGKADISIKNEKNEILRSFTIPDISSPIQSVVWDGRDNRAVAVPGGRYKISLTGTGKDGLITVFRETSVIINYKERIFFRTLWNGSSGLLFSATADTLPGGCMQLAASVLGHWEKKGSRNFPINIGFRYSPKSNIEINLQISSILDTEEPTAFIIGFGGKFRLFRTKGTDLFSIAITPRGSFIGGRSIDRMTNFGGFSTGIPLQMEGGVFKVILTPEIIFSPLKINNSSSKGKIAFYTWGYIRTGLLLDFRSISTGISSAIRLKPFSEGFLIQYPVMLGLELNWIIPGTQMVFSLDFMGEIEKSRKHYFAGGFGIGFLN